MQFNTDTEYVSISNHISRKVLAEHSKIRSLSNLSGSPDPANVRCCSESLSAPHGLPKRLACLAISARVKMPIPTSWKKKGEREKSNSTAPHTPGGGPQPADLETRASQQQHGVQCRISPTAALIGCCLWYVAPASYEFTKFCFFFFSDLILLGVCFILFFFARSSTLNWMVLVSVCFRLSGLFLWLRRRAGNFWKWCYFGKLTIVPKKTVKFCAVQFSGDSK